MATVESPPAEPSTKGSPGPWILGGIGAAAAIAGGVLYVIGSSDISSAENVCPNRVCVSASAASQGNNGRTLEKVGVVVGSVGLGTLAAGLIWLFAEKPALPPAPVGRAFVSPVLAPGYAGVEVGSAL
jgi:hypothetical protein